MSKFWDLYEKNVIISGVLGLALAGAVIYLAVSGQEIPEVLAGLAGTAVGYFFGAGKAKATAQVLRG
jgi:hypothetical protein